MPAIFLSLLSMIPAHGYHGEKRKLNKRQSFQPAIFLSLLSMIPAHGYHTEKRKLNKRQSFQYCKGFENMECLGIFFSLLSMLPAWYDWEKRKLKKRQGFTDFKGFENGIPDHIFLFSFHDTCTVEKIF
jgi:hypothetical protein